MTRLMPIQGMMLNLQQKIEPGHMAYLTKEQAYDELKKYTGQDFGYDVKAWKKWISKNMTEEWKWGHNHWFI